MLFCVAGLIIVKLLAFVGAATEDYYTAGVVEFRPRVSGATSAQIIEEHLSAYLDLIHSTAAIDTDIIVFPEATLNSALQLTTVPEPGDSSLCTTNTNNDADAPAEFLRELSCAARDASKYLVVNVKERAGDAVYNTNVVFDRTGCIVSRYRKWNLYLEPGSNRPENPEHAIFTTDFNVTFGHFICFDMLFYTPAQALVDQYGVHDIIVTNMFNSELPFLTASQLQQGWAWGNDINLLASGASLPSNGITGSGIYAGIKGALVRRIVGDSDVGARELLVARVPKWPRNSSTNIAVDQPRPGPAQRQLLLLQQPQLINDEFVTVSIGAGNTSGRVCHQDLCCSFEVESSVESSIDKDAMRYRMGVFVGRRSYEEEAFSQVRICGIFACRNESVQSCGMVATDEQQQLLPPGLHFEAIHIRGSFVHNSRRLLMPNTLSASLYALQPSEVAWQLEDSVDSKTNVELLLLQPQSELLTFAIYGHYFDEGADDDDDGGSTALKSNFISLCLMGIILIVISNTIVSF